MKRKLLVLFLGIVLILGVVPINALAEYTPPETFGAPEDFSVHYREDGFEKTWAGFDATVTASKELRSFLDDVTKENSDFKTAEFSLNAVVLQLDYRLDAGNWQYKKDWDEVMDGWSNMSEIRIESGKYTSSTVFDMQMFEGFSDGGTLPDTSSFFDNHSMDFRVRFIVSSQDSAGTFFKYASPWSKTISYSNKKAAAEDPVKLINHAPVLKSAEIKTTDDGKPYLHIVTDQSHEDLRHLNSISNDNITTEVWLKVGNGAWKLVNSNNFVEQFDVQGAEAYFGLKEKYDAAVFDMKMRYCFDLFHYPGTSKNSSMIYSPYSNIISKGQGAFSAASAWAKTELNKADSYGLIPESLKGADMTKPITREEFAELAVRLYEKTTGKSAVASPSNPFKDTKNPEILKAFNLGITTGTSATTFSPKELTNREQVATMLSRAVRTIVPNGDFSTAGAPVFSDKKTISSWALEHVQFMSKAGIITGSDGKFMPKALTTAEKAAGYGTTTREQAIVMSTRIYEKQKSGTFQSGISSVPGGFRDTAAAAADQPETASNTASPEINQPAAAGTNTKNTGAASMGGGTSFVTPEGNTADKSTVTDAGTTDDRILGTWTVRDSGIGMIIVYDFDKDGTYKQINAVYSSYSNYCETCHGKYGIKNGKITFSGITYGFVKGYWKQGLPGYKEMGSIIIEENLTDIDKTNNISFNDKGNLMLNTLEFYR
jgi:hypothetical protein